MSAFDFTSSIPLGTFSRWIKKWAPAHLAWSARSTLYEHLSFTLGSGLALDVALANYRDRMTREKMPKLSRLANQIIARYRNGQPLWRALSTFCPVSEVEMIAAGELSNQLPQAFELVLENTRRMRSLKTTLISGSIGPTIYLAITLAVVFYIASSILPGLSAVINSDSASGMVYLLFALGAFLASYWVWIIPVLLIIGMAIITYSLPRWTGPARIRAERFFPYSYYRNIVGYNWLMAFSAQLNVGVPDVDILAGQQKLATPYLRERLSLLLRRMKGGGLSLPAALIYADKRQPALGFPSPQMAEMIAALYGYEGFAPKIMTLAKNWANQLQTQTQELAVAMTKALEIAMLSFMAFLVIAINDLSIVASNIKY